MSELFEINDLLIQKRPGMDNRHKVLGLLSYLYRFPNSSLSEKLIELAENIYDLENDITYNDYIIEVVEQWLKFMFKKTKRDVYNKTYLLLYEELSTPIDINIIHVSQEVKDEITKIVFPRDTIAAKLTERLVLLLLENSEKKI